MTLFSFPPAVSSPSSKNGTVLSLLLLSCCSLLSCVFSSFLLVYFPLFVIFLCWFSPKFPPKCHHVLVSNRYCSSILCGSRDWVSGESHGESVAGLFLTQPGSRMDGYQSITDVLCISRAKLNSVTKIRYKDHLQNIFLNVSVYSSCVEVTLSTVKCLQIKENLCAALVRHKTCNENCKWSAVQSVHAHLFGTWSVAQI